MESLGLEVLLILWLVAFIAGVIDAIAGGGGLLTLPILLWAGMPPVAALATNKLQGSFGSLSASLHFIRQGKVCISAIWLTILMTFIGSASGALVVQHLPNDLLADIIPLLLIAMALYILISPRLSDSDSHQRISSPLFAVLIGFTVGFYDGFFGPGAGSFYALAFIALLGFHATKATAHSKVLNFTSNFASLIFFALAGHVIWGIGLLMGSGQILGAWFGAHLVIKKGAQMVRPALVTITLIIAIKLLMD